MKLYKDICPAWISRTSAEIFFSQIVTHGIKGTLKMYEELWTKIRDFIRSKTNNSDD